MIMYPEYTPCYDTAGTEKDVDEPQVSCGLVAPVERWESFTQEWEAVCMTHCVPYIHMEELARFQYVEAYRALEGKEEKRIALLSDAFKVMKRGIEHAFLFRMIPSHWHTVNENYHLAQPFWPSPFPWLLHHCIGLVERYMEQKHPRSRFIHVVEQGDDGGQPLGRFPTHIALRPKVDEQTKERFRPFEACDVLAYEQRLGVRRVLATGDIDGFRKSYQELRRLIPMTERYVSDKELFTICRSDASLYPRRQKPNASSSSASASSASEP